MTAKISSSVYMPAGSDVNLTDKPNINSISVVRNYTDESGATSTSTDSFATDVVYSIEWSTDQTWASNYVGIRNLIITDKTYNVTATVTVPYKYTLEAPTVTVENQNGTLMCTPTRAATYSLYSSTATTPIEDPFSYQWYRISTDGEVEISGATAVSYAPTDFGTYYCEVTISAGEQTYCTNTSESIISNKISRSLDLTGYTEDIYDVLYTAISSAPTNGTEYTITLSGSGTYPISAALNFVAGQNVVIVPEDGSNIVLTNSDPFISATGAVLTLGSESGTGTLTIQGPGDSANAAINISASTTMNIYQNVTIDGEVQTSQYCGGNIIVNASTLNLRGCTLQNNQTPSNNEQRGSLLELTGANSVVNMYTGTTITGNKEKYIVYFNNESSNQFNWVGGTITGNTIYAAVFSAESCVTNTSTNTAS